MTPTNEGPAAGDKAYHWKRIDENTPRGTKLQLINKNAGVAQYGIYHGGDTFWTHYARLPTFSEEP